MWFVSQHDMTAKCISVLYDCTVYVYNSWHFCLHMRSFVVNVIISIKSSAVYSVNAILAGSSIDSSEVIIQS